MKYRQLPDFSDYKTHWTIRRTQVLEEENREKIFEAKNVVKYLITSFKAEILFCFDISHNTGDSAGDYSTLSFYNKIQ